MDIGRIERWYRRFINPDDLIFDIGANEGYWSEGFSKLSRQVIALEPQTKVFERLDKKFKNSNVICINSAVGAERGTGKIRMPKDQSSGRSGVGSMSEEFIQALGPKIFNLNDGWDDEEDVDITTLDDLIEYYGKPNFIKIDVEGYELQVLKGLSEKIPLSIEFNSGYLESTWKCLDRLEELEYTNFNFDMFSDFRFETSYWASLDCIKEEILLLDKTNPYYGDLYAS